MKKDYPSQQPPWPIIRPRFPWRHQYDENRDTEEGLAATLACLDESLTQQHFTEDADLNVIAKRFGLNQIPVGPIDPSAFRDTTSDPTLAEILQHQIDARNGFMELPLKIRKRFHHSPGELWAFVNDPENAEEAVRLGLLQQHTLSTEGGARSATTQDFNGGSGTPATQQQTAQASPPESPRPKGEETPKGGRST